MIYFVFDSSLISLTHTDRWMERGYSSCSYFFFQLLKRHIANVQRWTYTAKYCSIAWVQKLFGSKA